MWVVTGLAVAVPSGVRGGLRVLGWGLAEAAPEVAVQVALVGEPGQAGNVGGAFAAFEEPAGELTRSAT